MAMRVTGMMSGLDTESIIQQLVAARQTKVDTLKKKQTTLEWKQEAWKDLNSKIYKLYTGTLSNLRWTSSYAKKTTTVSNSNLVSVITDDSAMNSVQSLKITSLAKAGYLTGGAIKGADGEALSSSSKVAESLGIEAGSKFEVNTNGKKTEITIDENTTIDSLVNQLKSAGVGANFDAGQQRFYIGASELGTKSDFTIIAANSKGTDALNKLGILVYDDKTKAAYEAYKNMSGTDQEKWITDRVEALHKQYTTRKAALEKKNETLEDKKAKLLEEYHNQAFSDGFDIENEDADARKTCIDDYEAKIAAYKKQEEEGNLSADDLVKRNQLVSELSYIKGYDDIQNTIDANDKEVADMVKDGYLTEDGEAGSKLTAVAKEELEVKMTTAEGIVNNYASLKGSEDAYKQEGEDCEIELNGIKYHSSSNTVNVNGLTITCNGKTAEGEEITLTTKNDTSGIYNMIKDFIKEYSALINEMDKLYNAESSKGYEPLTDDEKEAMSESEIEKWESKIKDGLLRRDSTISSVAGAMKEIMMSGFEVGGKKMYLFDFGIETMGYFNAAENEKNAYHIYGDEDDDAFKNETNKLMAMINSDPDAVVGFFTQLSQTLYDKMFDLMKGTDFSSVYKVYDDKKMKEEYDDYTTKIAEAEKKLQEYEDKWYKKFSAMETAMAKMQSNASAVTSLLGGS
ncbi:MAG: flagellar filament capping protein FliD [Lachnospiraceae bacterium]|nr:flagellar filament capping protein FliD [Lachnospiraceae bacterium]